MNKRNLYLALLLTMICFSLVKAESISNKTYAIVISGISKEPEDMEAKKTAIAGLEEFFIENNYVINETFEVLSAENADNKKSTKANIEKVMDNFKSKLKKEDKFIFYYTGMSNIVGQKLRLNLPGEDITHEQLAVLFQDIKASSILVVLDCPASGIAIEALSGKGRIIICSCMDTELYSTKFSDFFVPALNNPKADLDEDGKNSILEIFTLTAKHLEQWYRQRQLFSTETPLLDDNGDGKGSKEPWRYMLDFKDGLSASEFFF